MFTGQLGASALHPASLPPADNANDVLGRFGFPDADDEHFLVTALRASRTVSTDTDATTRYMLQPAKPG